MSIQKHEAPLKILLVDDDEDDFIMTRDALDDIEDHTYEIEWVSEFNQGQECILAGKHDVCLLDYRLGAHTGLEMLRAVRGLGAKMPIILLTGQGGREIDLDAMKAGASDYLSKNDLEPRLLERVIRYAAERSRTLVTVEELRKSESETRALLSAIPDAIFRIARDGTFLGFKRPSAPFHSFDPKKIIGMNAFDVQPIDVGMDTSLIMHHAERALSTGQTQQFRYSLLMYGQQREFDARMVRGHGEEVVVLVRDITEQQQLEETRNEFISILSQDLRSSLVSIRGALGVVSKSLGDSLPGNLRVLIEVAHKSSERLLQLISDLLELDKLQTGEFECSREPLLVNKLIEEAVFKNQPYADKQEVSFVIHDQLDGKTIDGDAERLVLVFSRLISLAIKSSPPQQIVEIQINPEADKMARISIRDCGQGIPFAFRDDFFRKGLRHVDVKNQMYEWEAVGLNFSKAIVERLDGNISFDPNQEHGTTFFVDLPLSQKNPTSRAL